MNVRDLDFEFEILTKRIKSFLSEYNKGISMNQTHHGRRSMHERYTYYCGGCGYGPVAQSCVTADHRNSHDDCRGAPNLEFQLQLSMFFKS